MNQVYKTTAQSSLKFKAELNLPEIPEGAEIEITYEGETGKGSVHYNGRAFRVGNKAIAKITGNEAPSLEELEEYDSIVPSILGNDVEPDGYDEYGSPSWMIALGFI